MLNRTVEKARQQEVLSREDTPTERRVLGAPLSHAGLSYRRIEPFVDRSCESIRQWSHRLKHLSKPDIRAREEVAVDETMIEIDGEEHYVWATGDCETPEALAVGVSPDRSSLDALLFLKDVPERCRGRPLVRAGRGPWYDWPLERLNCENERETWGSTASSTSSWPRAFAALHDALL